MSRTDNAPKRTVVAKRSETTPVETDEIETLVRAAGDEVVAAVTQAGHEDAGSYFGRGKVEELTDTVAETDARRVVVDDELTPGQYHTLESAMPDDTAVFDRHRLVLEIFEAGAGSRRAKLQVELAGLRYDLPRLIESADEGMLNEMTERGSPVYDVCDRIDRLERKLASLPEPAEQCRERRREEGFDLVTLAGYTNAGKSTLLHRLADEMALSEANSSRETGDASTEKNATAAVRDRLFETLETTTRRATIDGRPLLVTDTVGFVDDLPHDLVESFSATLSEAGAADVVVLVVDTSDPESRFRERLDVSLEVLDPQGVEDERIVPVLNKVDCLSADARAHRLAVAEKRLPSAAADPISVSVLEETNLERLRETVLKRLPTDTAELRVPNCDEAMTLVSRAYDRTTVETVDYDSGVTIECRGPPRVLEELRARADRIVDKQRH
ncbi:GTPase HflX [Natronobacterium gregoryi]|uniref:GTPase HflX n=2 Tax=Natronobacterium gregoryi TaxID=44930 RepID=L0ADD2_NATGS|nr:GTPase HflX [Natronobacterium gregoryi]AFZ71861.1 GTP-binding protein HflX [Natronobacterium gregoryi SP2]ELY73069.1 GTP-binding proten HflX [Natronobacterium gregoryi SP2]PLK19378.1 GTPase HflX [Natronobacterium gregoryi SP2]SFJ50496.1 GTP-binding protein HflX [Natronobacterium gregoryi]